MRYFFNLIFGVINYLFDLTLYYKIYTQESKYFKAIYEYIYPSKHIMYAKLYHDKNMTDITNNFINLANISKNIKWDCIKNCIKSNLDNIDNVHLEVKYLVNNNYYKIIFINNSNDTEDIIFPPYEQNEIDQYNNKMGYKKMILSAEINKDNKMEDITDIVKEYCGPLNNFYNDRDIIIPVYLIKNDSGEYLIKENNTIFITDTYADDFEFNINDNLSLK